MARRVADFIVERLQEWGVRRVFGYPGDGINGVMGALERAGEAIEFIQARHEEMCAFMACGHAKATGEPGVCIVSGGPAAVHILNGLYDAKADRQPVVAIVGQQPRNSLGSAYQQEIDLPALFKDVASEYVQMVTTATQARHVIDRAFRIAVSRRTPTCVIVPNDVQELEAEDPPRKHFTTHSGAGYSAPRIVPAEADLDRAAEILNAGKRVAMLIGAGAAGAADEVVAVADMLGAGIAKALLGKSVLPDTLSYVTGGIGLLGTRPTYTMMTTCDTLLMVGSSFPYAEFLPERGQARGVQVDIDPRMLGLRYPMEANLHGDAAETLRALLPRLQHKEGEARRWREKLAEETRDWWQRMDRRAGLDAMPVNPQLVFHELSEILPDDALLASDTGSTIFWYARHIRARPSHLHVHSGGLASMGAAMPYAIAAKFAYPDRPAIAMAGDGAMQMNGLNELITVARHWRRWKDPRFVVLVLDNGDLNFVTWEQRVMEGNPKYPDSQELPRVSFCGFAEMLGFRATRVDAPGMLVPALQAALSADRPVLVEVAVDPNVPMLPPHITLEQARNYLKAVLKGDPDAARIVRASIKEIFG